MVKLRRRIVTSWEHQQQATAMHRILFILKQKRDADSPMDKASVFTGARLTADALSKKHSSKVAVVPDANMIDYEIKIFDPTHVVIEGIWVDPIDFERIRANWPAVRFCVRINGDMDSLCATAHALPYLSSYEAVIACNHTALLTELRLLLGLELHWTAKQAAERVIHLPSWFARDIPRFRFDSDPKTLDVGSFNPLTPEGNHLMQAGAALLLADRLKLDLHFHVQLSQEEPEQNNTLENLSRLFANTANDGHLLVVHPWCPRSAWLSMCGQMDIGTSASAHPAGDQMLSDMASVGVPIIHSSISWGGSWWRADPSSIMDIARKMSLAQELRWLNVTWHNLKIPLHNLMARRRWARFLKS